MRELVHPAGAEVREPHVRRASARTGRDEGARAVGGEREPQIGSGRHRARLPTARAVEPSDLASPLEIAAGDSYNFV